MKFRTEIGEIESGFRLEPFQPVMMVGSCFADSMAERLRGCLWRAERPLGTLYNPASIESSLRLTALGDIDEALDRFRLTMFEAGGVWRSWMFDTKMVSDAARQLEEQFRQCCAEVRDLLHRGSVLYVTFGTAWCYRLMTSALIPGEIVANCHKQPAALFERARLDVKEIVDNWRRLISDLREHYPGLRIVFTVSPVRHVKDTLHGNALSKAILLLAVQELCDSVADCSYFPAYEIMTDDLRDYRYYASDLVHPGEQGVEYIWEHFKATYMDSAARVAAEQGEKVYRRLNHRPLIPTRARLEAEREAVRSLVADFAAKYPRAILSNTI